MSTSDLPDPTFDRLVQLFDLLATFFLGEVGSAGVFPEGEEGVFEERMRGEEGSSVGLLSVEGGFLG